MKELVNKYLSVCTQLGVNILTGEGKETFQYSCDAFIREIEDSPQIDSEDLCRIIGIECLSEIPYSFSVRELKSCTEANYQSEILSRLSDYEDTCCLDTHKSNKVAEFLCVSSAKAKTIHFNSLPNSIMSCGPCIIEVKSRYGASKSLQKDMSSALSTAAEIESNISALSMGSDLLGAVAASAVPLLGIKNIAAGVRSEFPSITLVEIDLLQQCLERIL